MSENTNDFLNDFLGSSEGNGDGGFADLPLPDFDDIVEGETKTETVETPSESPEAEEPVVQTQPQSSMFEDALKLIPAAKGQEKNEAATSFEDLREKYTSDFPELGSSDKVSRTAIYGSVTKKINNPGSDKVYEIKGEIEKSKAFLEGLKKGCRQKSGLSCETRKGCRLKRKGAEISYIQRVLHIFRGCTEKSERYSCSPVERREALSNAQNTNR